MTVEISDNTLITRNPDLLTSQIDGETVMMDIETGQYLGLDKVASHIWTLLEEQQSFASLCQQLCQSYDVDEATCKKDVAQFLQHSFENKVVKLLDV